MKSTNTLLFVALAILAFGQTPTAHVLGMQTNIRPSGSWACFYELRIDKSYTAVKSGRRGKDVTTGMDLPYRIDGRYLRLTKPDGKELKLEIQGTHE
jgi:hypothetical protein